MAVAVQVTGHVGQADGQWPGIHSAHKPVVTVGGDKQDSHVTSKRNDNSLGVLSAMAGIFTNGDTAHRSGKISESQWI